MCCVEILGTKASPSQVITALAFLLETFILHWFTWFLL